MEFRIVFLILNAHISSIGWHYPLFAKVYFRWEDNYKNCGDLKAQKSKSDISQTLTLNVNQKLALKFQIEPQKNGSSKNYLPFYTAINLLH